MDEAPAMAETARVAHFMAQLATGLKQLLMASQQLVAPPAPWSPSTQATTGTLPGETCPSPASRNESASALQAEKLRAIAGSLAPAKRCAAQHIVAVEKALRSMEREIRGRCQELLGSEELALGDAASEEAVAKNALEEAQRQLPLNGELQLHSLRSLRQAQFRSSLALAEFVQLPQRLKTVFDLTKQLSSEVEVTCDFLKGAARAKP
eukprot:TRINITY_DN20310_c0_g1_i1.p1 TRINITY_DN20310_c0_g1~~TRINITY_DN20310_c0_g1_i1.p1  ORF type:complete len:208 (-),score=56.14 TRINITY_DN20310_c0_g1_i1:594-1217(-)